MNLSQLRQINDGEKVRFAYPFPPFTEDKEYSVRDTKTGRMVYDDNGLGRYLFDIHEQFERIPVTGPAEATS
jgi:hypothetical protein